MDQQQTATFGTHHKGASGEVTGVQALARKGARSRQQIEHTFHHRHAVGVGTCVLRQSQVELSPV
jgi:hypothetical protein